MTTPNQTTVTDEQIDQELNELSQKPERTDEDNQKIDGLKSEKQTRVQKRMDTLTWRAKSAEESKLELEERIRKLEEEKNSQPATPAVITKQTVEISGKQFYTDETLTAMIQNGELSDTAAYAHQRSRDKAELKTEVMQEISGTTQQVQVNQERTEDSRKVLAEYPQFSEKHPDFNPNDPLYKKASEIFRSGLNTNPKGMSLSIEYARSLLGMNKANPDISNDLNLSTNISTPPPGGKKETPISEYEKESAVKMYCQGGIINPVTRKPYTEKEAIERVQKAKNVRGGA